MAHNKLGFTLVELLVVIAIIGILSTVSIINLNTVKAKARDAVRLHELDDFRLALKIYYEHYGVYPCGDAEDVNGGTKDSNLSCGPNPTADVEGFLNGTGVNPPEDNCDGLPIGGLFSMGLLHTSCPLDPSLVEGQTVWDDLGRGYLYHVTADRQTYTIATYLEAGAYKMANDGGREDTVYEEGNGVGALTPYWLLGPRNH